MRAIEIASIAQGLDALGWQAGRVVVATGFWQRALGLIGASWRMRHLRRADDSAQQANIVMVFPRCASVHTFFMGCAIDIAFIGRGGTVLQKYCDVGPGRFLMVPAALAVVERL